MVRLLGIIFLMPQEIVFMVWMLNKIHPIEDSEAAPALIMALCFVLFLNGIYLISDEVTQRYERRIDMLQIRKLLDKMEKVHEK